MMGSSEEKQPTDSARHPMVGSNQPTKDGLFLLKILLFIVIGSLWLRLADPANTTQLPIPIGFVIGLLFASHEHFQIDRKIEYTILLFSMFVGFLLQSGIVITY
jgi:hypothetical protein